MLLSDFLVDFLEILRPIRPTQTTRSLRSKYLKNWFKNPSKMLLSDFQIDFLEILRPQGRPKKYLIEFL